MCKILFSIISAGIFLYACSPSSPKREMLPSDTLPETTTVESIIHPSDSDTIRMNPVNGTASLKIHKKKDQRIGLKFNSEDYKKLIGHLSSEDSTANIRFSGITLPDGSMDGPFWNEITYDLPLKGDYLLFIHENQMAGDPWEGDFEVTLSLE